jgi:HAD superfamily hydrolase (TIGR01490 family)
MAAGAFFDLDRTLLRRSSALALAGTFRRRGWISRGDLAKAVLWQALFVARGAGHLEVRKIADRGLAVLAGRTPVELVDIVESALAPVLRPLLAPAVVEAARGYQARGYRTYIVSTALQEIVDALVAELGLDGGIGTTCEVVDGRYTGRALRALHGEEKAAAVRALASADGLDLPQSAAYSDSYSDLPFLEAVGVPFAVNPDRRLRRVAEERGWTVLERAGRVHLPSALGWRAA